MVRPCSSLYPLQQVGTEDSFFIFSLCKQTNILISIYKLIMPKIDKVFKNRTNVYMCNIFHICFV